MIAKIDVLISYYYINMCLFVVYIKFIVLVIVFFCRMTSNMDSSTSCTQVLTSTNEDLDKPL